MGEDDASDFAAVYFYFAGLEELAVQLSPGPFFLERAAIVVCCYLCGYQELPAYGSYPSLVVGGVELDIFP